MAVDPHGPGVTTETGRRIGCSTLVLCPGLDEDREATPGLQEALRTRAGPGRRSRSDCPEGLASAPRPDGRPRVFTMPPEPAPCGATALKPLFMACDHWRRTGVLADLERHPCPPGPSPVGVPRGRRRRGGGPRLVRRRRAPECTGHQRRGPAAHGTVATRTVIAGSRTSTYAHVVPHYRAPSGSPQRTCAGASRSGGHRPETLQHRRHASVWAIGDAADVSTRPSGGALRKQVDVLAHNLARPTGHASESATTATRSCRSRLASPTDARGGRPDRATDADRAVPRPDQAPDPDVVGGPVRPAPDLLPQDPSREGVIEPSRRR